MAPVDDLSDLDIELIFDDNIKYISDKSWINNFGAPIAMIEEDESYFDGKHAMKIKFKKIAMMIKTLTLNLFFLLLGINAFAQNKAGLESLLNKNSEFVFPQTTEKIESALHTKTIYYEDANNEKYAKWLTNSGLELYASLGKNNSINEIFFDIPEDKSLVVEGLPFHLILNKTTLKESKAKFNKYAAKTQKMEDGSTFPGGSKLTFKVGKHYATLIFDSNNLLRFLGLTSELIDPGVN